jgi:hypothetical protein
MTLLAEAPGQLVVAQTAGELAVGCCTTKV